MSGDSAVTFERDRYVVFRPGLADDDLLRLYRYVRYAAALGALCPGDVQVPGTPCAYGDRITDELLDRLLPEIETATGLSLFPTYSYFRVYRSGDVLARHVDRFSCEISVSLCLGYDAADSWPLWIEGPHGERSIALEPGEALLYRGIECPHWRERFCGHHLAQVFLHYVDQHGPYAGWRFDKRPALSNR
jgi:hypothetical protein